MLSQTIWPNGVRPSTAIDAVMEGAERLEDQSLSIQSCCTFYIYREAKRIMRHKTKVDRVGALNKLPELLRPHVKKEVERLWIKDK
jgi:uncharacterized protein with von Willebrand factor type A (vWA) domain